MFYYLIVDETKMERLLPYIGQVVIECRNSKLPLNDPNVNSSPNKTSIMIPMIALGYIIFFLGGRKCQCYFLVV